VYHNKIPDCNRHMYILCTSYSTPVHQSMILKKQWLWYLCKADIVTTRESAHCSSAFRIPNVPHRQETSANASDAYALVNCWMAIKHQARIKFECNLLHGLEFSKYLTGYFPSCHVKVGPRNLQRHWICARTRSHFPKIINLLPILTASRKKFRANLECKFYWAINYDSRKAVCCDYDYRIRAALDNAKAKWWFS
jgi:hypothetical protein